MYSTVKKSLKLTPGLWVIFRLGRRYGVSVGDPASSRSRLTKTFANKDDLKYWIEEVLGESLSVSENHILDTTGTGLVSKYYTKWFVENML